jgi:hypothetical protein
MGVGIKTPTNNLKENGIISISTNGICKMLEEQY